jgi:phospholipase/carboxylesterase
VHTKNIFSAGKNLNEAKKALVMIHSRGAYAEDILSLAGYFNIKDYALIAPQATNNSWYPYSFLAVPKKNKPELSSALHLLADTVADINQQEIFSDNIYFLGFSQGACLMLEFITRNARKWGGAIAFTGGLIGDKIYTENYKGDFEGTKIFIGSANPDAHVPIERVHETTGLLKTMHADVTEKIYEGMGHTINQDEINKANELIFI